MAMIDKIVDTMKMLIGEDKEDYFHPKEEPDLYFSCIKPTYLSITNMMYTFVFWNIIYAAPQCCKQFFYCSFIFISNHPSICPVPSVPKLVQHVSAIICGECLLYCTMDIIQFIALNVLFLLLATIYHGFLHYKIKYFGYASAVIGVGLLILG